MSCLRLRGMTMPCLAFAGLVAAAVAWIVVWPSSANAHPQEYVSLEESCYDYIELRYDSINKAGLVIDGFNKNGKSSNVKLASHLGEGVSELPLTSISVSSWSVPFIGCIDVSECCYLTYANLYFYSDEGVLEMPGLSNCSNLEYLSIGSGVKPDDGRLDCTNMGNIDKIYVQSSRYIKNVEIGNSPSLSSLIVRDTGITELDIPEGVNPIQIDVRGNYIMDTDDLVRRFGESNVLGQRMYTKEYYSDLDADAWYMQSCVVPYASDYGLITGYGNGCFGPYDSVTRGQAVTVLWRMAGEPIASSKSFDDVDYGHFYGNAINWARSTGVASGYADSNTFDPNGYVTREQLACLISNYAKSNGIGVSTDGTSLVALEDGDCIDDWARDSVSWCIDNGVLSGSAVGNGRYMKPFDNASRCEFAKMVTVLDSQIVM